MIREELSYSEHLLLLKKHIAELDDQKTRNNIASFSLRSIQQIIPGSLIVLTKYDEKGQATTVADYAGSEANEKIFGKFFDNELRGKYLPLFLKPEQQQQIKLNKLPVSFYILTGKLVSEQKCHAVEEKLQFKNVYVSQLGVEKKLFGSILIFICDDELPTDHSIIEIYSTLLSLFLSRKAIEESFLENQSKLSAIIEDQTEFIVRWDVNNLITFVNESYARYLGLPKEDIVGTDFYSYISSKDISRVSDKINALNFDHPVATDIHKVKKSDEILAWHEWTDRAIFDNDKRIVEFQSVGRDISALMELSESLKKSELNYRQANQMLSNVLNNIPVKVFWKDKNSVYLGCNQLFATDAGKQSPEVVIGLTDHDMPWKNEAELYLKDDQWVVESGISKLNYIEPQTITNNRKTIIRISKIPLRNQDGVYGVLGTSYDITEQVRLDKELKQQNIFNELRANIWKLATNENISGVNSLIEQVIAVVGKALKVSRMSYLQLNEKEGYYSITAQYFDKQYGDTYSAQLQAEFLQQMPMCDFIELPDMFDRVENPEFRESDVYKGVRSNFDKFGLKNYLVLRMGNNKVPDSLLTLSQCENSDAWSDNEKNLLKEIAELIKLKSEQFKTRQEIVLREKKYKDIFDNSSDGICILDEKFRFIDLNRSLEKITGYSKEELITTSAINLVVDESMEQTKSFFKTMKEKGKYDHFEVNINTKQGNKVCLDINSTAIINPEGHFAGSRHIIRDITKRVLKTKVIDDIQEGVSTKLGEKFLERITYYLWKVLGADFVFVAEPEEKNSKKINTLVVCDKGKPYDNFTYKLDNTPCESIISHRDFVFFSHVQEMFPHVELLKKLEGEDFIGIPLFNSDNSIIGVLAAVYKNSIEDPEFVKSVMGIFASRIGAEIERLHKDKELIIAHKKAIQSDKLKSAFLANMSHEIRTPMNAIIGFSELLAEPDLTEPDKLNFVNIIQNNSNKLLKLISDIIDIAKIEAGQVSIDKETFSMNDLLSEMKEVFDKEKLNLDKSDIEVICNIPIDHDILLYSDKFRVNQILTNLISNAIKFTEVGHVTMEYEIIDSENIIKISVSDTGFGMNEAGMSSIFERFIQLENKVRKTAGTGLGLSISQNLAKILGGIITVESEKGKGSNFTLQLPLKIEKKLLEPEITNNYNENKILKGKHILVAEDEISNFDLLKIILEKKEIIVEHAFNGKEVIRLLEQNNFDLLLCDLKMPVMEGFETLNVIRSKGYKLPVVALTAFAMNDEIDKAQKAGFSDYVTKPFRQQHILDVVSKYL